MRNMRKVYVAIMVLSLASVFGLSSCGDTMEQRAATGGLGGVAAGALVGGPVGAVIGGAAGAGAGAATSDEMQDRY